MRLRRLVYSFTTAILSTSSLFILAAPAAHAANVSWDGGGGDSNFSTAANWSADTLPVDGDVLVFDVAGLGADTTLNNDLSNLSAGGITVMGTGSYKYTVTGNDMTINSMITVNSGINLNLNMALGGDVVISGSGFLQIGDFSASPANTFDLNSHNLTVDSNTRVNSIISGNGNIATSTSGSVGLLKSNTFTGSITFNNGGWNMISSAASFGNAANIVTLNDTSGLSFCGLNGATVANPIILNSSVSGGALSLATSCGGGGSTHTFDAQASVILSGTVTLQHDTLVDGVGELTITGPLQGSHTIGMAPGSVGKLTINSSDNQSQTSNGSQNSVLQVTEVTDQQPSVIVSISANQVVVMKAGSTRGMVYVSGGTLKGIGTVGEIDLSSGSVAPGMSPGVLNSGNLAFTGGTYDVELAGTSTGEYDQLNVTGTVNLGNATVLSVNHYNKYWPTLGNTYTIINNDGNDAVTGTFNGLAEGATVNVSGVVYTISYKGGDGNDVVLTATTVPKAPNTGFAQLHNPLAAALLTIIAVVALAYAARRFHTIR